MSAYVIVSYDIVDQDRYGPYVPGVVPLIHKHGGEIVIGEFAAQPLEGAARSVYVVLKFPSEKSARAWHADPDYEPLKQLRLECSENTNIVLAKPAGE